MGTLLKGTILFFKQYRTSEAAKVVLPEPGRPTNIETVSRFLYFTINKKVRFDSLTDKNKTEDKEQQLADQTTHEPDAGSNKADGNKKQE